MVVICHYSGMGINPECHACDGIDTECEGFTAPFEVSVDSDTKRTPE